MSQGKNKNISLSRFITILILMFLIYLLCTDFMYMKYNGSFANADECEAYTVADNNIDFNCVKKREESAICGVIFEAITDDDKAVFSINANENGEKISPYLYIQETKATGETTQLYDSDSFSYTIENFKNKDEIKLFLLDESESDYILSGTVNFNSDAFKTKYVYDTTNPTLVAYTAFDLLFGSRSIENMNFNGNLWALFFWLPPITALCFFVFDSKSYAKNLVTMGMSVLSIFSVIRFVGGERLAMGSMLTIVINLVLFIIALYPILHDKKS